MAKASQTKKTTTKTTVTVKPKKQTKRCPTCGKYMGG